MFSLFTEERRRRLQRFRFATTAHRSLMDGAVHRILDASLNRASEGLRVVEDYARFALDDRHLTKQFKHLRHDLAATSASLPWARRYAARDTLADVGASVTTVAEMERRDAWDVCRASLERIKQSLRSLEEYSKITAPAAAAQFEALRYRLYTLEAATGRTVDAGERLAAVRLYVLVDGCESEQEFESLVRAITLAGVDAIQFRSKSLTDRDFTERARLLLATIRHHGVSAFTLTKPGGEETGPQDRPPAHLRTSPPGLAEDAGPEQVVRCRPLAIINDRPDVAALVDADGVHVGQDDLSVKDARRIVGPGRLVGVSTHSIEQARAAVLAGATYLGVGPTFPSRTKEFADFPGLEFVRQVAAEIRLPAFAIGGIGPENVAAVRAAGLGRIAVSSAVTKSPAPAQAVHALRTALR